MARETPEQQRIVGRVMHEFKQGKLKSAGGKGGTVRNPRQSVAIGLSEAGASNRESPQRNRKNLARTRLGGGEATRADLYAQAAARGIAGRSRMSKDQLRRALGL